MPYFQIRFVKTVPDDTGHEHLSCQFHLELDAADEHAAVRRGVAEFCRRRRVRDWTAYADALELWPGLPEEGKEADAASREARPN